MSNYKVFEIQAISNEQFTEFVKSSVEEFRNYTTEIIKVCENISAKELRFMCYFSLIECVAQDIANYPARENQKAFTEFVLKYQTAYSFLEEIDPITLFYRVEQYIGKLCSLDNFIDGSEYAPTSQMIREKAKEIEISLKTVLENERTNKYLKNHRYVDLLYRFRCKLSHEFSSSHIAMSKNYKEPYYICCSRYYLKNKQLVQDNVWTLNIPVDFVKSLCENCINNYLDECLRNNHLPLPNNTMNRFCELSWYPKP